jgi:hypothetical protein
LIDLPALDVGEARLNPAHCLSLLGGDAVPELALALAQPLGDLVQRSSALALVHLDLSSRGRPGFSGGALELLPELREDRALVLAGGLELLHLRFEPRLGLADRLALALRQLGETSRQSLLDPVEVGGPFGQTLLDAALDEGKGLAELARDASLSLSQFVSPGFGELSFVFGEARGRFGSCACKRALELLAAQNGLPLDQVTQRGLGGLELGVGPPAPRQAGAQRERQNGGCETDRQSAGGHGRPPVDVECEDDPGAGRGEAEQPRDSDQLAPGAASRQRRGNRPGEHDDADGEGDLHGGLGAHNAGS